MGKLAIISDIHGNIVALETVLADLEEESPDQIICLGDVGFAGPHPAECVRLLKSRQIPVVKGNTDAWLLDPDIPDSFPPQLHQVARWSSDQLSEDDRAAVEAYQPTIEVNLNRLKVLCFHACPQNFNDIITATTPDDELKQYFGGVEATVVTGGHTHVQLLRRWRDKIFVNPGSVGAPCLKAPFRPRGPFPTWAEYAVIEHENGHLEVGLRRAPLDVAKVLDVAAASKMPHLDDWVSRWPKLP